VVICKTDLISVFCATNAPKIGVICNSLCYYQTPVTELTEKDKRKKQKRNSWLVFLECEPSRRSLVGRRRKNGVVEKIGLVVDELRRGGKRKGIELRWIGSSPLMRLHCSLGLAGGIKSP
jgi:hypothetical protein